MHLYRRRAGELGHVSSCTPTTLGGRLAAYFSDHLEYVSV